jgi:hypothetical protein
MKIELEQPDSELYISIGVLGPITKKELRLRMFLFPSAIFLKKSIIFRVTQDYVVEENWGFLVYTFTASIAKRNLLKKPLK